MIKIRRKCWEASIPTLLYAGGLSFTLVILQYLFDLLFTLTTIGTMPFLLVGVIQKKTPAD